MKTLLLSVLGVAFFVSNAFAQDEEVEEETTLVEIISSTNFEKDLESFLIKHLTAADIITINTSDDKAAELTVLKGYAEFWWEDADAENPPKKVCQEQTGAAFSRCVKEVVDTEQQVTIWRDKANKVHAEI